MNGFIELLERKIIGCDALGGLEREKAVYQSVLKDYKKQLNIGGVVSRCCEETRIVNQFLQRPYKYCKSCNTELK